MISLPRAHVGQTIGLLEVLEDFKGRVDVARVANDLMLELDDLLPAVETAKLLGFLRVESGDLVLSEEGKLLLSKGVVGRKKLLNKHLANLAVFKAVLEFLKSQNDSDIEKEELVDFLHKKMPDVETGSVFPWIVEWGRYSLLLQYDSSTGRIKLYSEQPTVTG